MNSTTENSGAIRCFVGLFSAAVERTVSIEIGAPRSIQDPLATSRFLRQLPRRLPFSRKPGRNDKGQGCLVPRAPGGGYSVRIGTLGQHWKQQRICVFHHFMSRTPNEAICPSNR